MPNKIILIVIAVLLVIGVAAVIAYYVARFMRGTIRLTMAHTAFNPGDPISGSFELHTKKAVEGNRLIVSLIGTQVTRTRGNDGEMRTRTREIYRDEVLLEEARSYEAGARATHNFEIAAPDMHSAEFMDSALGQALSAALSLISNKSTRIKWRVEARLDARGVDLAASKAVSLNIKQLM